MRALLSFASAVGIGAAIAGCQVYDPSLVEQTDAGGNGGGRTPPPRPDIADTDGPEVAFGMRRVVMDQGDEWATYGYDVDGFVTTPAERTAECVPPARMLPGLDGPGGVDNIFGSDFFPLVALTTPDLESQSRTAQELGHGLPIVRIFGWNGEANDPRVDAQIMQAVFGNPGGAEDTPPASGDPTGTPVWDGRDWFWVRDDAFLMGDPTRPLIRDDNAYVADDIVVARLPSRVDIIFPAERYGVLVRLTDAVVTGHISADRQSIEHVIVSGRWAINDLLGTASNIGVCPGSRDYELLSTQLDTIADVRSDPGTGGEGVHCDAISIGVGFTGSRLRVAGLTPGIALRDLCTMPFEDGGTDPDGGVPGDAGSMPSDAGLDGGVDGGIDGGIDAGVADDAG